MFTDLSHVFYQEKSVGSCLLLGLAINVMVVILFYPAEILGREMDVANSTPNGETMVWLGDDGGSDG